MLKNRNNVVISLTFIRFNGNNIKMAVKTIKKEVMSDEIKVTQYSE